MPPLPHPLTWRKLDGWSERGCLNSPVKNNSSLLSVADLVHFHCEIQVGVCFILSIKSLLCFKSYLMQNNIAYRGVIRHLNETRAAFVFLRDWNALHKHMTDFHNDNEYNYYHLDDKMSSELSLFVYWQVMSVARSIFRLCLDCEWSRTAVWSSKFTRRARVCLRHEDQRRFGGYWITEWLITLEFGYLNV